MNVPRKKFFPDLLLMAALLLARGGMGQTADDARWDDRFAVAGVQGNARAMAFDKKRIYVGGEIQSIGRNGGGGVVEFDGKNWRPLPGGPEQVPYLENVFALKLFNNRVYAGGAFPSVGGRPAGGFASWHGNKWSIEGGTNGVVYALSGDESDLLVGGRFTVDGFTNPVALARFNGREWRVLNSELPPCGDEDLICLDSVKQVQLLPNGDAICIVAFSIREPWGGFSYPFYHLLMRCDSQAAWSAFSGPDGDIIGFGVNELTLLGDTLIAAGSFTNATNAHLRNIAQWNGTEWVPLGEGLEAQVYAVAGNEQVLYALHDRDRVNPLGRAAVSKWDGRQWQGLGGVQSIASHGRLFAGPNDDVYVSGLFAGVDAVVAPGLAHWDGQQWKPVVTGTHEGIAGLTSTVATFTEHQGSVYMGGLFLSAGSRFVDGLARWDGSGWRDAGASFGAWPPRRIRSLVSSGERLYAGGAFTEIGAISATNIASWDGSTWSPVGGGITNNVAALAWWNSNLYAGGLFETVGDVTVENIAAWDGRSWRALAGGCNSNVVALTTWRGALYAGGRFTMAGNVSAQRIARWDGTQWHDVGQGIGGEVESIGPRVNTIAAGQDGLYVGGRFTLAGSSTATNIARWDGTNWHDLKQPWGGTVNAIAVSGSDVFAGGQFIDADEKIIDGVLRWDGTNWNKMGSGIYDDREPQVFTLLAREDGLFVGGRFTHAGGKPSASVAQWSLRPK